MLEDGLLSGVAAVVSQLSLETVESLSFGCVVVVDMEEGSDSDGPTFSC